MFLQDPENMIVRLDTIGLSTVVGKSNVALAAAGTRMTASGDCNSTWLSIPRPTAPRCGNSMTDDAVNNAVSMLGKALVQSGLPFGSGVGKLGTPLGMRVVLCLVAAL